ncbi:hypothetical protein JCM10908_006549 [Rhodotorula pacifica]|uniref:uncharacterized protein n=1 Tax=Rhodotorula pacifica TaxID=1495444 RepID=UPI0031715DEC
MTTQASPRSSASDPLSPQQAAATLSWSAVPALDEADERGADIMTEASGEEDEVVASEMTPELIRASAVAGLGGLLFGYDTGVTSSALLAIGTALGGRELTLGEQTGIVVSALWGALFGSLVAGRIADIWGRKPVIIAAAVLFILGALEQAAAQFYKEVILGRVLVGIAVGLSSMILPMYLAEIAPSEFRGRVVASMVVLITGGQVLAYVIGASFFHITKGWRWMFGLGAVPAITQVLLSFSLPESPRHHLRKGRIVTAQQTLQRLNPSWSRETVQKRLEVLRVEVQDGQRDPTRGTDRQRLLAGWREKARSWRPSNLQDGKLGQLWRDRANRRALLVACGLQFFQQATGFNTLMYYAAKIIHQTGLGQPAAFAVFIAVSNFLSTIIALRLIDHVGRRALLLRTLLGMFGGMALLSFAFLFIHISPGAEEPATTSTMMGASPWAFVAVFAMCGFCVSYALGLGNVAWVVQSEVFNQELRAFGNGLATAVNWSANLIVSSTFLHLSHAATPAGAFGIYAIVAALAWIFTWTFLPETKGLSLEEVRAIFEREVGIEGSGGRLTSAGSSAASAEPEGGRDGYHVVGDDEDETDADLVEEVGPHPARKSSAANEAADSDGESAPLAHDRPSP